MLSTVEEKEVAIFNPDTLQNKPSLLLNLLHLSPTIMLTNIPTNLSPIFPFKITHTTTLMTTLTIIMVVIKDTMTKVMTVVIKDTITHTIKVVIKDMITHTIKEVTTTTPEEVNHTTKEVMMKVVMMKAVMTKVVMKKEVTMKVIMKKVKVTTR